MEHFHIKADELNDDEVQYELELRDINGKGGQEDRRVLRNWFRSEATTEYLARRSLKEELLTIPGNIQGIENALRAGRSAGSRSRLIHYYRRLKRCKAMSNMEEESRAMLMNGIGTLALQHFEIDLKKLDCQIDPSVVDNSDAPGRDTLRHTLTSPSQSIVEELEGAVGGKDTNEVSGQLLFGADRMINKFLLQQLQSQSPGLNRPESMDPSETHPLGAIESLTSFRRAYELDQCGRNTPLSEVIEMQRKETSCGSLLKQPHPIHQFTTASQAIVQLTNSSGAPWMISEAPTVNPTSRIGTGSFPSRRSLSPPLSRPQQINDPANSNSAKSKESLLRTPSFASDFAHNLVQDRPGKPPNNNNIRNERKLLNYVHVADVEKYVQTYLNSLLSSNPERPIVRDTMVNNLARQIADVGIHDSEMCRLSHVNPSENPGNRDGDPRTERLYGNQLESVHHSGR